MSADGPGELRDHGRPAVGADAGWPVESEVQRVRIGGVSPAALRTRLLQAGVRLNTYAEQLLVDPRFVAGATASTVAVQVVTVAGLGFPGGACFAQLVARAATHGLSLCPLELAPHWRLQWPCQPEGADGRAPTPQRAPPGSVTVASAQLAGEPDRPCGFYLRRIHGVSWLRGYRSDATHCWDPGDALAFLRPGPPRTNGRSA